MSYNITSYMLLMFLVVLVSCSDDSQDHEVSSPSRFSYQNAARVTQALTILQRENGILILDDDVVVGSGNCDRGIESKICLNSANPKFLLYIPIVEKIEIGLKWSVQGHNFEVIDKVGKPLGRKFDTLYIIAQENHDSRNLFVVSPTRGLQGIYLGASTGECGGCIDAELQNSYLLSGTEYGFASNRAFKESTEQSIK